MSERRIPDLWVEQLALGELSPERAAQVRRALGGALDARLAALAADDAETRARLPPAKVAAEVERRLAVAGQGTPRPVLAPALRWGPALAVAAALALAWWWLRPGEPPREHDTIARVEPPEDSHGPDVVRIKGDARLVIYRLGEHGPEALADGDFVAAGDGLQIHYDAGDDDKGVIVSIDGDGAVTLHFPEAPGDALTLAHGGDVALGHSIELDDAPAFERFVLLSAPAGVELSVVGAMAAARRVADGSAPQSERLALGAGVHQRTIVLRKR